ncbi:MAG: exo-alpha-sialidase [Prevotella sp.]|nr:exo-alpha-sialidase [Candidatus Prevotella equi]
MKKTITSALLLLFCTIVTGQVRYTGNILSNPSLHDGGLAPVIGVHCIQTMRSNREHPDSTRNIMPWTYNHQPMMARWHGKLWIHYLSDPVSEHIPPSQTYMQTTSDGYHWSAPTTLFPIFPTTTKSISQVYKYAVMHQRIGWYVSSKQTNEKLLALGHYGICLNPKDDPNDGKGIGRVVREVHDDGTLGPIYFLYYNTSPKLQTSDSSKDLSPKHLSYPWPLYTASKDKKFRQACEEILRSPLMWMGMVEECDRNDERLPLKNIYKAFCHYTLPDDTTIVGLWKHALTSQSKDGGKTWSQPVQRAKGFVNSNAKIWGQRLSDGTYATVYNPSEYRWPLAISTSTDGEEYTTLNLIHGEISPLRYGGQYKSRGPQYVRGIEASDDDVSPQLKHLTTPLWVTYSMNKEDIWVAKVPVPVRSVALEHANDNFSHEDTFNKWNIMSLICAPVKIEKDQLMLADSDPLDFAKAERIIPATRVLEVEMNITPQQAGEGELQIELLDSKGTACSRLVFEKDRSITIKTGARKNTLLSDYQNNTAYTIKLFCDLNSRMITVWIDGKKYGPKMLFAPIESITRLSLRTGEKRYYPTPDTPADTPEGEDIEKDEEQIPMSAFYINNVKTRDASEAIPSILVSHSLLSDYCNYFNNMEPEGVAQAIPNANALQWMKENIPLFECPDKQIEEMYYYRWWSFRKAIQNTPKGFVINEFLVNRSYADKYNLISCALGHHIMEARWLRDSRYIEQDINVWLRGNDLSDSTKILSSPLKLSNGAAPMWRLDTFSSWLPWAMWQRTLQLGNTHWMSEYNLDLQDDIKRWEETNSYGDGLFWQRDVKDGMEEQISGARKKNNRRPTINSYMWGNYTAMANLNKSNDLGITYKQKADILKRNIEEKLWNSKLQFYGTLTTADTLADVREEIGFLPWYFGMPEVDNTKYLPAWKQLMDEKGFNAPFGITTAERRHPMFRKRFKPEHPSCEWDGAVWPFATSQTLTALMNFIDSQGDNADNIILRDSMTLKDVWFYHIKKYTESQYRRGKPYIGEYLDETNGQWLMGDRERSKYYNHSTYNDLIITGLVGLRPNMGDTITVKPMIPDSWDYFCMSGIPYHGKIITIFYDKYGNRYHQGKGLHIITH